jgi:DNA-binding response OmpR family regulator
MRKGTRILLVEDDRSISSFVAPELEHLGFNVRCACDGVKGLEEAQNFSPDLITLIKAAGAQLLVVTARDAVDEKVAALDLGADDYLTKPFDIEELLARLRALLRRAEGDEVLRFADLEVNTSTREARRGERKLELTAREYELLEFMVRNPRRVLSRDLLLSRVWDEEFGLTTNLVDVYVGYLRKKVDAPGEEKLIHTVRGAGYALRET